MTKRRRAYGTYSTNVDVDIDVADVVAELTDSEIKDECALRGITTGAGASGLAEEWRDFADELRSSANDRMHLEVLIIRMLVMAGVPKLSIPKTEPVKA